MLRDKLVRGKGKHEKYNDEKCREKPARATNIKICKAEVTAVDVVFDQVCYQETADHEKDVYSNITTAKRCDLDMKQDHADYRDGSQSLDVGSIGQAHECNPVGVIATLKPCEFRPRFREEPACSRKS